MTNQADKWPAITELMARAGKQKGPWWDLIRAAKIEFQALIEENRRMREALDGIIFHSRAIAETFAGVKLPNEALLAQGVNGGIIREIAEQALNQNKE